jgi:tetratricopeptide (TPR) repeat protein
MLNGETFGDSVRAAREEIWLRFPNVNTWGAYQCYGDQGFRLVADGRPRSRERPRPYLAPVELVVDLENLRARIRMGAGEYSDDSSKEEKVAVILRIRERIPASAREQWEKRADVAAAIGFVYGELSDWSQAIAWLERALNADKADCPVRVIEQYANFKVRLAAEEWSRIRLKRHKAWP